LVQPSVYGWNNTYIADCLQKWPDRFAGVCLVDPRSIEAAKHLEHWVKEKRFSGVRVNLIAEPDASWLLESARLQLWEAASSLKASISIQMLPRHAESVATLASRHPAAQFIVDYLGPQAFHDASGPAALTALSAIPNVHYKILALGQDSKQPYPFTDLYPLYMEAYRLFGADRLILGTDYPHVLRQGPYEQGLAWFDTLPFMNPSLRQRIGTENAQRMWLTSI
jgi:predicted TIM-barrel fold metal-dependent hydrolase